MMGKQAEKTPLPPAERKADEARAEHDREREAYEATLDPRQRPAWSQGISVNGRQQPPNGSGAD